MLALKKETQVCVCARVRVCVFSEVDSPGDPVAPKEARLKKLSMAPANAHFVTQTGRER